MKLHIIYRSTGPDSKSHIRPKYFNKTVGLKSFLSAVNKVRHEIGDIIFMNDGEMPVDRVKLMESAGKVTPLPGLGNSGSFRAAFNLVKDKDWDDDDIIYFAEDDYLYKENSLSLLIEGAKNIKKADYFTLYDHPDRYSRTDDAKKTEYVFFSGTIHWRSVESTCISFGARVGAIKKNLWLFKIGTIRPIPKDRHIFRAVQGIGQYFFLFPKRILISPIPSLCCHMENDLLAKGVDWESVYEGLDLS